MTLPEQPPKLSLKDRTMAWGERLKQGVEIIGGKIFHGNQNGLWQGSKRIDKEWPRIEEIDRAIDGGKK